MTSRRSLLGPAAAAAVILTMLSLSQVFVRQRWALPSLVGVGIAFGVGWVSRRLDVPGLLAPALSVLALVTWLGIAFHPSTTIAGIPTGETMRAIGESLRTAGDDIRTLAAPAEATDALTLLATWGVFLVAVMVDVMVFRLRRPVAAGIPLLALFLVPTSLAEKPNAFAFVVAAFGYLGILVAEGRDRARAWGRRLSGIEKLDELGDVSHVARVGRRIGSAAVGLALAIPVVLPSTGDGIFTGSGGGLFGKGGGPSRIVVINPIVEIADQLHDEKEIELFRVRPQGGGNTYMRLTSLDEFNGSEWRLIEQEADNDRKVGRRNPIPQPDEHEGVTTAEASFHVEVGPLGVQWLPVPYAPRTVDVGGSDWKYEPTTLSVFTARDGKSSKGVSYDVTSLLPQPTPDQLRAGGSIPRDIARRYLRLPDDFEPSEIVLQTLDRVTGDIVNPYDKALALQDYFRRTGGFRYSLIEKTGTGDAAISVFLDRKVGYCEQFAATMAYLARLAGIPARVAVGFTAGTFVPDGTWSVTNHDAHAWPELYFPNAGWVRFEPTPGNGTNVPAYSEPARGGDGTPTSGPTADPTGGPSATPTPSGPPGGRGREEALGDDTVGDGIPDSQQGGGGSRRGGAVALGAVVALAALATPSLVGYGTRRRRRARAGDGVARTHAAWESLADAAEDAGYRMRVSDSPRAAARRLVTAAGLTGPAADEVARMASAEERARYARSAVPVDGLEVSARVVRKALLASLSRWARVRATVFPASAVRRMRLGYASATSAAERSGDAVRARLRALVRRVVRRRALAP